MRIDLWYGDCLELMKNIPDKSIDMVLTDPPYGTTACKWDTIIPFEPMWAELKRITRGNGAICLFGGNPFQANLIMSNIRDYKYEWIWNKKRVSNPVMAKKMPLTNTESITVFNSNTYYPQGLIECNKKLGGNKVGSVGLKTQIKRIDYRQEKTNYPRKLLEFSADNYGKNCFHPTQKPVPLLEYLIKTYTLENETVLDFTMGSGSTGVACKNINRNFIGIEKDGKYFEIAKNRINEQL